MKKKLLISFAFILMTISFIGCDLLSTIQAVKGFYDEYQTYSSIYENATQMTVQTDTTLTISNSTIDESVPSDTKLYFMVDSNSNFLYVDETIDGVRTESVYEDAGDLYIQYLIDDNNVVTPTLPEGDNKFNSDVSILNENFSYQDVSNENKTGDHTYEFDVFLNQVVNLNELNDLVNNNLHLSNDSLADFNNAIAHVVISFSETDSTIDIRGTVSDYTVTSAETGKTITFSISNHTILKVPENFSMPDVFSSDYQMKAVDDIRLARKVYQPDDVIAYPITSGEAGFVQLQLTAGTYQLSSMHLADISGSLLQDSAGNNISIDTANHSFTINQDGTYFLKIVPTASFESDIKVISYTP